MVDYELLKKCEVYGQRGKVHKGIVSGCNYNTSEAGQPYEIPACEHHIDGPNIKRPMELFTMFHTKRIYTKVVIIFFKYCLLFLYYYKIIFFQQFSALIDEFIKTSYSVRSKEEIIQREIVTNGPVEGTITVYEDFMNYKSGVYQHVVGKALGGHTIRILGWRVEEGTPYWLIANSWNSDWGDNGYVKLLRGANHCGIEGSITARLPLL
ncbi:hypothetical protein QYM36_010770 [Artemia franciscana]|uniref:Peptidase C1A papain C-terminal domain-containing protein n=1 Tax=Artemia franciscana TaxID=6661 RepID=A0AA88HYC5_ARTSF|nr:hypothetical protein QYM36_010770 [Artemia franciscana]